MGEKIVILGAGFGGLETAISLSERLDASSTITLNEIKFEAAGTCYIEVGAGSVAMINANFLKGPEPRLALEGPTMDYRKNKLRFENDRIGRWFK